MKGVPCESLRLPRNLDAMLPNRRENKTLISLTSPDKTGHVLASAVGDSNAAAQDKALDALLAWTRAASDRQVEKCVDEFFWRGRRRREHEEREIPFSLCIPHVFGVGQRVHLVLRRERRRCFAPVHSRREKDKRETEKTGSILPRFSSPCSLPQLLSLSLDTIKKNSNSVAETASATICSKCLKARPATVSRAVAALSSLVEAGCGETVLAALLPATTDKVPKAAAAAVDALRALLAAFGPGPPHLPLQPVFRALPALFESKTGAVREGAKATAVELSRWRGASAAVRATLLPAVPAAARAEVEKAVAEAEASSSGKKPERLTRAEAERKRRKKAEAEAAAAAAPMEVDDSDNAATATTSTAAPPPSFDDEAPSDNTIDPYDLAQPLDVLGRLPKTFWDALKAAKWSERRAALQQLREAAAAPGVRLSGANADFAEICRALKSILLKDSNAAVVAEAGLVAAALATGARREFSGPARVLLGPLLGKLRDKQSSVCAAAAAGARAILVHCCSGSGGPAADAAEEIAAALTAVSPKGRALAAGVFAEAVSLFSASVSSSSAAATEAVATSAARALSTSGPVAKALAKCASDADPAVRAAAVGALAALAKAAGGATRGKAALDKLVSSSMLDAKMRAKVDAEVATAATTSAAAKKLDAAPRRSAASAAASSPAGHPAASSPAGHPAAAAAAGAPVQRARVMLPPSRSSAAAASPALSRKPLRASAAASSSCSSADDSAPFEPASMSASEAEAFLEAVLGPGGGAGEAGGEAVGSKSARSSSWKTRLAAMDSLLEAVSSSSLPDPDLHLVPACLSAVPGWSDSNFQVVARALAVVAAVAERSSSSSCSASAPLFPASAAAAGALGAAERLGDPKLKPAASAALDALACVPSSGGPSLVLSVLKARATSASKKGGPKLPAEALRWAAQCVSDFGAAACCFGFGGGSARRSSSSPPPPPRFLMAWARQSLDAPQPEVRSGGTALLCALHRQCGPAVAVAAREGLKPAAAASLDAALEGCPFDAGHSPPRKLLLVQGGEALAEEEVERPAAPRATAKQRAPAAAGAAPSPSAAAGAAPSPSAAAAAVEPSASDESGDADALLPRKDISSSLTPALFARFSHPNWKERNAALGEVEDAVEEAAGGRGPAARRVVSASGLGALPAALAERASRDANANISARAFCVATTLSLGMRGPDFDRVARAHLLAPALSALGDKKRAVREAAEGLLDAWASALPADRLLPAVCDAACGSSSSSAASSIKNNIVISSGSEGRAAALLWLARAVEREAPKRNATLSPECVSALIRAAGRGWADKAASAREGGIALASALGDSSSLVSARALVAAANRMAAAPAREAAREVLKRAGVLARAEEEGEAEEQQQQQRRAPATPSVALCPPPPPAAVAAAAPRQQQPVASTPVAAAQQQQQQRTPWSVSALGAASVTLEKTPAPPETTATPVASASARRLSAPTPAPPPTVVAAPAVYDDEEEEEDEFRTASSEEEGEELQEEEEEDPVAAWDAALADLHAPDTDAAIEGIKFLLRDLGDVAAGRAPSRLTERCAEDADALVAELARRVDPAFDALLSGFPSFDPDGAGARHPLTPGPEDGDLAARSAGGARTAKYVLNALLSAFAARPVARAVRPRALRACVGALLGRLLDDALPRAGSIDSSGLAEGATLLKGLNVLMLRVLDSAHPDAAYAALLALLRSPPARVRAMAAMSSAAAGAPSHPFPSAPPRNHRFDDLVVKCLVKLARNLRDSLPAMDPAALLLAVHECLESLGNSSRSGGSGSGSALDASAASSPSSASSDRPARAVKALLLELCRARGAQAMRGDLEEAGLLPPTAGSAATNRLPLVASLVDLHLRTLFGPSAGIAPFVAAARAAAPALSSDAAAPAPRRPASLRQEQAPPLPPCSPSAAAAAPASTPAAPRASPSTATAAAATAKMRTPSTSSKAELAAIFRRIGRKETSEEGLAELAAFGRARGGIRDEAGSSGVGLDLGPHLARTSEHFRAYISRGVARANAKFEAERGEAEGAATTPSAALSVAAAALVTPSRLPPLPPSPGPTPLAAESAPRQQQRQQQQQQREPLRQQQQQSPSFMSPVAGPAAVPAASATSAGATSTFSVTAPVAAAVAPSLDELRARVAAVRLSAASSNSVAKGEPSCGGGGGIGVVTNNSTLQALQARMAALRRARQ